MKYAVQVAIAFVFGACFNPFAPGLERGDDFGNLITEQKTPEETLQNFAYAYTLKDSLLYSELLDESFVFEYFEPDKEPSGGEITWGRDDDLRSTGIIFRTFDAIDLQFVNLYSDMNRRFVRFDLSLVGSSQSFIVTGRAVFDFILGNDGKWRIVRWKDESDF